jgi:hypothetical protein
VSFCIEDNERLNGVERQVHDDKVKSEERCFGGTEDVDVLERVISR